MTSPNYPSSLLSLNLPGFDPLARNPGLTLPAVLIAPLPLPQIMSSETFFFLPLPLCLNLFCALFFSLFLLDWHLQVPILNPSDHPLNI